jgi:hypothetical protein
MCSRSPDSLPFASLTRSASASSSLDTRTAAASKALRPASMSAIARSRAAVDIVAYARAVAKPQAVLSKFKRCMISHL